MASPKTIHQKVSAFISSFLYIYVLRNQLGQVFSAPFDVHFDKQNIVQPDVIYVSNSQKEIIKDWIFGAPDLAIEIISPTTKQKDKNDKFKLYQKHGVLEYWMVDTQSKTIEVHILKGKKFILKEEYKQGSIMKSNVVKGFEMAIDDIFEQTT